jgi:hypothetical protein
LTNFFDPPNVKLAVNNRLPNGFDVQGTLVFEYEGMIVEIQYSKITDGRNGNEIQGEKRSLLFDAIGNPARARIIFRDGSEEEVPFAQPTDLHGMEPEIRAFAGIVSAGTGREGFLNLTAATLGITDAARGITDTIFPPADRANGEDI